MKPIVLRAHEVRGLLEGRVTLLHRPIKPQPFYVVGGHEQVRAQMEGREPVADSLRWKCGVAQRTPEEIAGYCPFGKPGDLLWGRETLLRDGFSKPWRYAADGKGVRMPDEDVPEICPSGGLTCSSTQMPKRASRITLEIKEVRVHRVQSITEEEAEVSGIERVGGSGWNSAMWRNYMGSGAYHVARNSFASLWESTEGWDSLNRNDWVWALSVALSTGEQKQ